MNGRSPRPREDDIAASGRGLAGDTIACASDGDPAAAAAWHEMSHTIMGR